MSKCLKLNYADELLELDLESLLDLLSELFNLLITGIIFRGFRIFFGRLISLALLPITIFFFFLFISIFLGGRIRRFPATPCITGTCAAPRIRRGWSWAGGRTWLSMSAFWRFFLWAGVIGAALTRSRAAWSLFTAFAIASPSKLTNGPFHYSWSTCHRAAGPFSALPSASLRRVQQQFSGRWVVGPASLI